MQGDHLFTNRLCAYILIFLLNGAVITIFLSCSPSPTHQKSSVKSESVVYMVTGMHCDGCARSIENAASSLPGVIRCSASFEKKNVVIEYDAAKLSREQILQKLNATGYTFEEKQNSKQE